MAMTISSKSESLIAQLGFDWWGTARLERPHTFDLYRQWLADENHGEMEYLRLHLPQKENPQLVLPMARSALVVAVNYLPHPEPMEASAFSQLKVARYALGSDYHHWLKERLEKLIAALKVEFPDDVFMAMTDSYPVMERDLAQRAGLGWFGKNTCLINAKEGSFFLIGEIYTSLDLDVKLTPPPDLCGTCRRCIDLCPTQALKEPYKLDARRCISYWTIESRGLPPEPLRHQIGDWFFGCDICQQVCPWNEKAFGRDFLRLEREAKPDLTALEEEIRHILTTSNNQLQKTYAGSPLNRAGGKGLKRNAILVATRHRLQNLKHEIAKVGVDHPQLASLIQWSLEVLQNPAS